MTDDAHAIEAAKSRARYADKLDPATGRLEWAFAVKASRRRVFAALRASAWLSDIPGALEENCGHGVVFRHLMAPPVSQDQFRLLCPNWSKAAENSGRPATKAAADSAAASIISRLDPSLITWIPKETAPARTQLRSVLKVAAALMAAQKVATARRTKLSTAQELSVIDLLEANGWIKLPSKLIDTRAAVAPKHFMHKTRFATKTRPQEVDIACGLRDTFVLAMECKVTNDETNSVKRINDILKKATAWHDHWGSFVVTAALLDGVVAAKDVRRLEEAKIKVFWSHDLESLQTWLAGYL